MVGHAANHTWFEPAGRCSIGQPQRGRQQRLGFHQQILAVDGSTAFLELAQPLNARHHQPGPSQRARPRNGMAMEPPGPLQQQIHRRNVGEQNVKIDIQGLLEHLRADHDQLGGALAPLADRILQLKSPTGPVERRQGGVKHDKRDLPRQRIGQRLGPLDRVDNHPGNSAIRDRVKHTLA